MRLHIELSVALAAGKGLVDIKCSCKHRHSMITLAVEDWRFLASVDGKMGFKRFHLYSYLVETQLHVCEAEICDFWAFRFHLDNAEDIFIERISPTVLSEAYACRS